MASEETKWESRFWILTFVGFFLFAGVVWLLLSLRDAFTGGLIGFTIDAWNNKGGDTTLGATTSPNFEASAALTSNKLTAKVATWMTEGVLPAGPWKIDGLGETAGQSAYDYSINHLGDVAGGSASGVENTITSVAKAIGSVAAAIGSIF